MTRTQRIVLFALLSLAVTGFIFSNSVQNGEQSNARSGIVAQLLEPILNPRGTIPKDEFHKLVRKLAHFTEFGALGVCLGGFSVNVGWPGPRRWGSPALIALGVALTDEGIQSFTGRTNSMRDVLIDFSGVVCGLFLVACICWLLRRLRQKQGEQTWQN